MDDCRRQHLDGLAALSGKVAHEFNNLMTGVLGHAGLARLDPGPASFDAIEALALRAADLCRRLATFAGPSARAHAVDLAPVIAQAAAGREAVEVDAAGPAEVRGDPGQIAELIGHLLDNALDAGHHARVRLIARADGADFDFSAGPLLWLEVQDDGPGIAPAVRGRLFEPFVTTRDGRRGLGLAAVLGIVRGHRGAVRVLSRPGEGTRVRVGLPAACEPAATPPPPVLSHEPGPATVLLADDEEAMRDIIGRLLGSLGCRVIAARDGEEAVAQYRAHTDEVNLALLDLTMPRLDGERTMRALRAASPVLPIVLMSGYPEGDLSSRFAAFGLAGFLQKPFRLPALQAVLRRARVA